MSSDFMLALTQALLAALAGGLTLAMARTLRLRRGSDASEWTMSWFALAASLVFGSVHLSPAGGLLFRAINATARALEVSTGVLQVGLLVAVAWTYARARPLPRTVLSRLLFLSIGLGVLQVVIFGGDRRLINAGVIGRVGANALLTAVALPLTAIWLMFVARARATVARGVLAAVYVLIGGVSLLKVAYVMGLISALPPSVTPASAGLLDVARYTALGVASALILVEKLEAKAATSAEDAARALEAKARSDSWFRTLVENAPEMVLVVDRVGRCLYASQSVTRTAGRRAPDMVGQDLFDCIHPTDRDRVRLAFDALMNGTSASVPVEFRIRKLDGDSVTVEATGVLLPGANSAEHDSTFIIIARDVTARHAAEDRERSLAQQLHRSQKTESLGRFAGGVAHDCSNLLTVIYGHVSVARKLIGRDHPAVPDLDQVEGAARRAGALTRQLLLYSRRQVTDRTPLEFDRVVGDLSQMLERIVGENIQFETRLSAAGAFVLADRGELEQVVVNLVLNARDAMRDDGHLLVETGFLTFGDSHTALLADLASGTHVEVTVSDTGRGIPAEHRELVFEPFFTTKAPQGGTGLGLATSEGIVRQHQGRIWFESSAHGTRFHVCFPVTERAVLDSGPAEVSRPRRGPERVLLVEDEPGVRYVAAQALREQGYHVVDFGDPLAARLTAASERFDVLVTDVVMPGLSGLLLADQITVVQPQIKLLFISGYSQESEDVGAASRLAGHRFLAKPFHREDLATAVGELLADQTRPSRGVPRT